MVYAMRPPALDELGLVPRCASRRSACATGTAAGLGSVAAPVDLRRPARRGGGGGVPDRHRGARQRGPAQHEPVRRRSPDATVGGLQLRSPTPAPQRHVATGGRPVSMRERAAELGGTLDAGPGPTGGKVAALLPL